MTTANRESLEVMETSIDRARQALRMSRKLSRLEWADEAAMTAVLLEMEQLQEDDEADEDAAREEGE